LHSENTATVSCTCNKLQQIKWKYTIVNITGTTNSLPVHLRMQCIIDYRFELQVVTATLCLKHTTQNGRDVSIDMIIDYYISLQFILLLLVLRNKQ
jgi:hypothetical protein